MTDRKVTCVACKSAITEGNIAHSDLEFGGELKATNQPEYTADADTDLVATVGTLDGYTPMIRTTGNQIKVGAMTFIDSNRFTLPVVIKNVIDDITDIAPPNDRQTGLLFVDKNGEMIAKLALNHLASGVKEFAVYIFDKNKQQHKTVLATYTDS